MSKAAAPRSPRGKLVATEVMERAAVIFAERGFDTSLQEVADEIGISRPALYHYFDSKQALLAQIFEDMGEKRQAELTRLRRRRDLSALEKVAEFVRSQVRNVTAAPARFRLLERSHAALPPDLAATFRRTRQKSLHEVTGLIADGIQAGELRPIDPHTAALGLFGIANWTAYWYREDDGSKRADEIAETMVQLATTGLAWPDGQTTEAGLHGALKLLKESVAYLEQLIDG